MAQIVAALQNHGIARTAISTRPHRPAAQLPRDRPRRAPRARRSRRRGRLSPDRHPVPPAAARPGRRRARDAPARRFHAPLSGAAAHRRRLRVHGLDDAVFEPRRRCAPRASRRRRGRHDRLAPRARLPEGRAARELGRRLALRILPPAGGARAASARTSRAPSATRAARSHDGSTPRSVSSWRSGVTSARARSCSTGSTRRSSTRPIRSRRTRRSTCTTRGTATVR